METCRICGENISELDSSVKGAVRQKTSLKDIVLQKFGIDFNDDPDSAPKLIHAKCRMQVIRGTFSGAVRDYNVGGDSMGGEVGEEGENTVESGENIDVRKCILCRENFGSHSRRDIVTKATVQEIIQIYRIPDSAVEALPSGEDIGLCGACRGKIRHKKFSQLPGLHISLPPSDPAQCSSQAPTHTRPERRKKDLMNLKTLIGKNKSVKSARPELAQLLQTIERFCDDKGYDAVELGFYLLHKVLSSYSLIRTARQLKLLYDKGSYMKISPRRSVANKFSSGRSHRSHRQLALFLKQQLGRDVFPAREAEDEFVDTIQPRAYSYKVYSLSEDPQCCQPLKQVIGLKRPTHPDTAGKSSEETAIQKEQHKAAMKLYKKALAPPDFIQKYMNDHCESPLPNALISIEEYDRLLAAHLHQLGPQILNKIEEVNKSNSGKKIPMGRVNTKITVIDGSDGFSELKIISSRQERQFESHGITMDFSVISVAVEHQADPTEEEGNEEALLSQAMSQSSIEDNNQSQTSQSQTSQSQTSQSQNSQSQNSQSQNSQSQNSQSQSSAASQSTSTERPVESTESSTEGGKYTVVYEEKNPNSPLVSRPIFR